MTILAIVLFVGWTLVEEVSAQSLKQGNQEDQKRQELRRQFWGAVAFTLPIFIIAMGGDVA